MDQAQVEVARLAGVAVAEVEQVRAEDVRAGLRGQVEDVVLEVATEVAVGEGRFWKAGAKYFLDDPYFGPVVDIATLRYDSELGLLDPRTLSNTGDHR